MASKHCNAGKMDCSNLIAVALEEKTGFDLGLNVWIVFMDGNVGVDLSLKL